MSIFSEFQKDKKNELTKKEIRDRKEKTSLQKPRSVVKNSSSLDKGTTSIKKKETKIKGKVDSSLTGRIKKTGRPALVLLSPYLSEKATALEEEGKYVFRVDNRTNKIETKKAFEELYRTKVVSVNIVNIPRKKRMWRGKIGYRPGYKKAIIKVAEGQKANIH